MRVVQNIIFLFLLGSSFVLAEEISANKTVPASVPKEIVKVTTYEELRHAISETRDASRKRVQQAVEQERVREAWEIGRLIDTHVLQHKERADYAKNILGRLSKDLGISRTELSYMLQFARAYQNFPSTEKLSWGHYRELLSVNDPEERKQIAEQAVKNKWGQKTVREAVRKSKSRVYEKNDKLVAPLLSKPGSYRVILAKTGPFKRERAIDLGFSTYLRLSEVVPGKSVVQEGQILAFSEENGNRHFTLQDDKTNNLFTYKAWACRVLDGDTIEAVVDLGFGIATTQTLRLRGIDAPELVTADGVEAKHALEKIIANTQPLFIKTQKSDKYDRYLVDVFALASNEQGRLRQELEAPARADGFFYVNQALVDQGYAVVVGE